MPESGALRSEMFAGADGLADTGIDGREHVDRARDLVNLDVRKGRTPPRESARARRQRNTSKAQQAFQRGLPVTVKLSVWTSNTRDQLTADQFDALRKLGAESGCDSPSDRCVEAAQGPGYRARPSCGLGIQQTQGSNAGRDTAAPPTPRPQSGGAVRPDSGWVSFWVSDGVTSGRVLCEAVPTTGGGARLRGRAGVPARGPGPRPGR